MKKNALTTKHTFCALEVSPKGATDDGWPIDDKSGFISLDEAAETL